MNELKLQSLLDDARAKHGVIGATLGVLRDGHIETCASGSLNLNTRVECTTDSVFQIGSISKVFTATLIMQLVDQGRLSLDDAVIKHLPDFALADQVAAQTVTVRQLLNHTCGMDGDFFPADDPEGPSTVSYVRKMCLLTNLYPPGEGPVTYSNSGFAVAGRIVEVLTGMPWQQAVMELICKPLGLPAAFAHPHESLRYRCAMGHVPDTEDPNKMVVAPETYLPISMSSVGSVLTMSAESLLMFAQAHMADGSAILTAASTRKMREDKVPVPVFTRPGITHWALGWFLGEGSGYRMVGHDGGTRGHFTYLRTFPERNLAFTVLTNSPSDKLFKELEQQLMQALLGTTVPTDPPAESFEGPLERYVGRYRNVAASYTVTQENGKLRLQFLAAIGVIREFSAALEPYRRDVFEIRESNTPMEGQKICFLGEGKHGRAAFFRIGARMARADD